MESSYQIGPFEMSSFRLDEEQRFCYDINYTKDYIIDHDWGDFGAYVSRFCDKDCIRCNDPEFGWTLVTDRQLMLDLVNGYNCSENCRGELFKDIDTLPANKLYYIRWIDWS